MADVGGRIIEKFATNLAAQLAVGGQEEAGPAGPGDLAGTAVPGDLARTAVPGDLAGTAVPGDGTREAPVEDLQLPVRAFNSLRREGIHTVGDLAARNEADLLAISNLGPQSISEIKQKLAERGLGLAPATAGTGHDMAGAAPQMTTQAPATRAPATQAPATQAPAAPSLAARPPDEDAIDLLSVAGFPVLKRALPAAGVVAAVVLLLLLGRRRRRRRGSGTA
jgi:hypothetical protein